MGHASKRVCSCILGDLDIFLLICITTIVVNLGSLKIYQGVYSKIMQYISTSLKKKQT